MKHNPIYNFFNWYYGYRQQYKNLNLKKLIHVWILERARKEMWKAGDNCKNLGNKDRYYIAGNMLDDFIKSLK
jgi:hypothetical protein